MAYVQMHILRKWCERLNEPSIPRRGHNRNTNEILEKERYESSLPQKTVIILPLAALHIKHASLFHHLLDLGVLLEFMGNLVSLFDGD